MKTKLHTNYSQSKLELKLLLFLFFILISNALQAQNANEFPVLSQNGILVCGGQTTITLDNYPVPPNAGAGYMYTSRIYQWKRNGTPLPSAFNLTSLIVTLDGTYTCEVTFFYTSPPFQTTSLMRASSIEVVYDSYTSLSIYFPNNGGSSVCFGGTTTLSANAPSGSTVGWERNDGDGWYALNNGGLAIISVTGTIANSTFDIRARAYAGSCPINNYSDVRTIEVMPELTPPIISGPDQACYGSLMTLTAVINNPNTPVSDPRTRIEWESYNETFNQWSDNFISSPLYTTTLERIAYPSIPSYNDPLLRYDRARINYNGCYSSTSTIVTTIINPQPTVQISTSGTATICEGVTVNLTATVGKLGSTGTLPVSYQWKVDGNNVPSNGTSATYTASVVGDYSVTVLHAAGCAATSIEKSISLDTGPVITSQPAPLSVTKCQGQVASFSVSATGAGLTYQWRKEGVAITGNPSALTATLNLLATTPADASGYDVVVSGCTVEVVSDAATLTIISAPQVSASLSNLTYCEGVSVPAITLSGLPAGVTFNITGGSTVGLANQTGVTTIPSFTAATGTATITVTPTTTTCEGIVATYTITVISAPPALNIAPNSAAMCLNDAPVLLTSSYGFTPNYCIPVVNGGSGATGHYLRNVTFGNINNNSIDTPTDYTYYSGLTANVVANGTTTYPFSLTGGGGGFDGTVFALEYIIWIDFNQNGIFEASESVFSTTSPLYNATGTVTIPTTAYNGITRMRVAAIYDSTSTVDACLMAASFGEFEDYNISITGGVNPPLPVVWSPTTGLFTDAAGTTAYVGGASGTVYAKPSTTTTYIATAANAAGCSTVSNSTPVNVIIPTVTASYSLCTGAEFTVTTVSNLNNLSYQWTVPAGFSNPGNVSSFTSSVIGNYSVVITDLEYVCSSSASTFTINNLTATISGSSYRCDSGGTVLTSNVPSTFGTNVSFQWQRNGIDVPSNGNNATYTATLAGDYSVTIANNSSNCALSSAPFAVSDFEYISFETLGGGSYCSADGLPVTLSGSQTEVTYGLLKLHPEDPGAFDVVAVSEGTGGPLTFPNILEGEYVIYSILFDDESNFLCDKYMTGTVSISFSETIYYEDSDGDGYGNPAVTQTSCDQPIGYVTNNLDCDDGVAAINPTATEVCWNNLDDNCDGTKSEGCAPIPVYVNNPVSISSFSTHLSAIPYTYAGATSLDYRFEVTNISVTPNQTVTFTQSGVFARFFTIPVAIRGFNTTYSIRASAVINGEEVPYAVPVITLISTGIPTIKLSPTSCGASLSRLNATISANPGFNATSYEFRIRLTSDNGATPTYYYAQSLSRFIGANSFVGLSLQYNTSYSVSVRYTMSNGGSIPLALTSSFGSECAITTPSIPLIGLSSFSCDSTIDRVGATISANPAAYAQHYQFRVRLTSDNGVMPNFYTTVASASRYSSLMAAQGLVVASGTQYSVSVRYSISLNGAAPTFTEYGPECVITTPSLPTTTVSSVFCDLPLGNQLNEPITINTYSGNPIYRIKLEERQGPLLLLIGILDTADSVFSLNMFSGTTLNKDYEVSVAMKLNDVFGPYGNVCRLKTYDGATPERTVEETFTVRAYPNPFSEGFQLNVKTENASIVSIKTYDMIGRLMEERSSKVSAIESISIGTNYPSGIYNVIVSQEDEIRTVRVVKR